MDTLQNIRNVVETNRRSRNLREGVVIWIAVTALVVVAGWGMVG